MLSLCFTIGLFLGTVLFPQDVLSFYQEPIVSTNAGRFQGIRVSPPGMERAVNAFVGIPYAKPPTGPLRFGKPVPADFIPGIFSATIKPPSCFQLESDFQLPLPWTDVNSSMSEDCLYLNIWTPETIYTDEELKPVMVWIHGGGFTAGSSAIDLYDGKVLCALGEVVVVTFNYRLGPFGFLEGLTEDTSGNAALYDQLLVLKWVQTNIEYFGGDPKSVTLFGESAGAMVTSMLAISPLSRGLFHRLITQSGSSYAPPNTNPIANVQNANLLASLVGCANDTFTISRYPKEVVSCLRSVPACELTKTYYTVNGSEIEPVILYYRPQFWDDVLPKHPIDVFLSRNYSTYDLFTGVTQEEGSSLFSYFFPDIYQKYMDGDLIITKTMAASMLTGLYEAYSLSQSQEPANFYLKDIGDDEESVLSAIFDGIGDPIIVCPTVYFAERYSDKGTPVFFYRFDHRPSTTPWPEVMGAAHFEEVQFVFGLPLRYPERYQYEEKALSEYMVRTWTDFAKSKYLRLENGTQWPSYSHSSPSFATFQTCDNQIVGCGIRTAACEFWRPYFNAY